MSDERERWSRFLSAPIDRLAAGVMADHWIGRRFGSYEIVAPLGAGGMGEVYRARDSRLGRDVAIKVLPAAFVADRERLARFEREARVLAALNDPHIASIYGVDDVDGATVLVLELVDGETLAHRIARGPIPIAEALAIARQIAEALEAAHEKGIVHRDLKPSNIAVTPNGTVKVLDFGLAKAATVPNDLSQSPTFTIGGTRTGVLLGTAAYMSPEQARGQSVDKRTDIWAFGCVLYEMLTGHLAFAGDTASDHIAAILDREPAWTMLPTATPATVRRALRRCLEKDPKRRLHDVADARIEVGEPDERPIAPTDSVRGAPAWIIGVVVGIVVGGLAVASLMRPPATQTRAITRSTIALPSEARLPLVGSVALSPDGRSVVFAAQSGGRSQLFLRPMDGSAATSMAGTDGASSPFFSPDGQWVGFFQGSENRIKRMALSGGTPQNVCDAFEVQSAAWGDDGMIVFTSSSGTGLVRVPASGGVPQNLTTPNRYEREKSHRGPEVLPGGKAIIFTVGTADITSFDDARIEVVVAGSGQRKVLIRGGMNARYVSTGHLVYARAGSLLAVPFDVNRLEVTGPPVAMVDDVSTDPDTGYSNFAVSRDGSLLYTRGGAVSRRRTLLWADRQGRRESVMEVHRSSIAPRLSPDGRRVAVSVPQATGEVWVYDLSRSSSTRLVYGWDNNLPIWSPDGARVAFISNRGTPGSWTLFSQAADGTGAPERLMKDSQVIQIPQSWSPDGRFLVFTQRDASIRSHLWIVSLDDWTQRPIETLPSSGFSSRISPDGRWIAYTSDQSGRFEVYVQAFPTPSRTWQVSTDGGVAPEWARNGRELFYQKGNQFMAVEVSAAAEFRTGPPTRLFERSSQELSAYDVASDGRFLMLRMDEPPLTTQLTLVQNWLEELKARVPSK